MLTDAQWTRLEPLIEACRPKGKTPPRIWVARSRPSSGGIRTEPSGAPCPLTWVLGPVRLRPSSAGHAWACGSTCCSSPKSAGSTSG